MKPLQWARKHWKRLTLGAVGATALSYVALVAPALPYLSQDLKGKTGTEQDNLFDRSKTYWGGLVWYPINRVADISSDLEQRTLVVNPESQRIFIYDDSGTFSHQIATSTGKQQGDKKTVKDLITPPGEYLLVRRFTKPDLDEWFGKRSPKYGNGMLLFLGHWFPHIAVHGTLPESEKYLGHERSSGCPRVSATAIDELLNSTAIGTRMVIHPYGVHPVLADSFQLTDYFAAEGITGVAVAPARADFLRDNPQIRKSGEVPSQSWVFLRDYNGDGALGKR